MEKFKKGKMDYRNTLFVYYQCLVCGIITKKEFLDYIDKQIEILDNPPLIYIDIAFLSSKRIDDIIRVLKSFLLEENIDINSFNLGVLSVLKNKYTQKEITLKEGVRYLYELSREFDLPDDPEELYLMGDLDDELCLHKLDINIKGILEIEYDFEKILDLGENIL